MSGPRAKRPTTDELRRTDFLWEYNQVTTDVTPLDKPRGSVLPLIHIQRRLVGSWEIVDDQA